MAPSAAWNHFIKNKTAGKVKCKICGEELTFLSSTTNMLLHLKYVHKIAINTLPAQGGKRKPAEPCSHDGDGIDEDAVDNPDFPTSPKRGKKNKDDDTNVQVSRSKLSISLLYDMEKKSTKPAILCKNCIFYFFTCLVFSFFKRNAFVTFKLNLNIVPGFFLLSLRYGTSHKMPQERKNRVRLK